MLQNQKFYGYKWAQNFKIPKFLLNKNFRMRECLPTLYNFYDQSKQS